MTFNFKEKEAIIFDFDGTIADTFHLHEEAFKAALEEYNLKFDYKDYLGRSTKESIQDIFNCNHRSIDNNELEVLTKRKQQLANQSYKTSLNFLPGALNFIELLHKNNFALFIGSSGSAMNINAGVTVLGIANYFKKVITSNDVKQSKPHPEVFQTILTNYNIDPLRALVIEDAASGIEAACAAGIDVICVNHDLKYKQYETCVVFSNFYELKDQLQAELQDA